MSDHADLLRRAAAKARETAEAATPGPWWAHRQEDEATVQPGIAQDREQGGVSIPNADHIALWHPGVALAVAEWLEQHEAEHSTYDCQWEEWACAALKTARALLNHPEEA